MTNILPIVRRLIGDTLVSTKDIFTYTSSKIFSLSESNVVTITDVYVNSVETGVTHTYSATSNKVTITSSLTSGDTVEIDYTTYLNYSDTELENQIRNALVHLGVNNYYTFIVEEDDLIYPTPSDEEKNLIALITSIIIKPDNKSYRLPDLSISVPNNSLPTEDKIRKAIAAFKKNGHGIFSIS